MEGAKQFPVNSFRQADFRRNAVIKEAQDGLTVHALRGSGQAQQHPGLEGFQRLRIGIGSGMMGFVDDDIIIIIRRQPLPQRLRIQCLHGNEEIIQVFRLMAAYPQFPEVGVLQYALIGGQALLQDFFPVSDEQQPIARLGMGLSPTAIVQRRDHRFARAGGGYHQVAVIPAHFPLCSQLIQNGLLVGIGADVK